MLHVRITCYITNVSVFLRIYPSVCLSVCLPLNEIYTYYEHVLYRLEFIFFHKVSMIVKTLFPHLRVKLFAEASALCTLLSVKW
jgi:hypothetical protein